MDTDSFRRHAHAMVDWMADYMDGVAEFPVRARTRPGEISGQVPERPPHAGEDMDAIFADFRDIVLPGVTHWQHPDFYAYFPANSSPPSVLAEMLTATLGANCMLWQTSPAGTELETRMTDWLRQMIGLPEVFHGVIQDTASSSILCALLTARERKTGWTSNRRGLGEQAPLTVYTSAEAHSATEKGVGIAGFGRDHLRLIETDDSFAMRPDRLEAAVLEDRAAGRVPACVVASLGTTGVGGCDPLRPVAEVCRRHDMFLHVDAAWAGSALILPEHRALGDGLELADSLVFNPHKLLMTNFDCSAHFVRDPDALIRTFSILPEFLKSREAGEVIDFRDWGIALGRRFRALKLWFVIRSYGVDGLQAILRRHIALAAELEQWIAAEDDFELLAPRSLSLLNFRYRPAGVADSDRLEALNAALLARLNDAGRVYFTQNRVRGTFAIRWSIGQTRTGRRHVEAAWAHVRDIARGG